MSMPENPLAGYRFVITLDPGDAYLPQPQADQVPRIAAGAFSEVTGLSGELEVTAYPEGGVNDYVHQLPGREVDRSRAARWAGRGCGGIAGGRARGPDPGARVRTGRGVSRPC